MQTALIAIGGIALSTLAFCAGAILSSAGAAQDFADLKATFADKLEEVRAQAFAAGTVAGEAAVQTRLMQAEILRLQAEEK